MRIVISPSSQEHNACDAGDTEQAHCRLIGRAVTDLLNAAGQDAHLLLVGDDNLSDADQLAQMSAASNALHADLHIDIHTDAGGATGPTVFYTGTGRSRDLGRAVWAEIQAAVPWPGGGCTDRSGLWMLRKTTASAILVECWPHDRPEQARWGHAHIDTVARAIARGVLTITGGTLPPEQENTTMNEIQDKRLAEVWEVVGNIMARLNEWDAIVATDGQPYHLRDYVVAGADRLVRVEDQVDELHKAAGLAE